jgi:poly(3-hydroxybutyrate) depolymerase
LEIEREPELPPFVIVLRGEGEEQRREGRADHVAANEGLAVAVLAPLGESEGCDAVLWKVTRGGSEGGDLVL